jgi:putative ABC transport system permease protein
MAIYSRIIMFPVNIYGKSKMKWQLLTYAFNNLKARQLRSWLTILGVIIGIAAVVTFMLIGQGLQSSIQAQFQKIGVNKLMISPGQSAAFGGILSSERLSDHDIDIIKNVRGVDKVGGMDYKNAKITFKNEVEYAFIIGMPSEITIIEYGMGIEHGRELAASDKYEAVVGYDIYHANNFFDKPVKPGNTITIQDTDFKVVGSAEKVGNHQDDTQIYIPIDTANTLFNQKGYAMIIVLTDKTANVSEVATAVSEKLRKDRNEKRGEEDFTVQTFEQVLQTFGNILGIVQLVVIGIAAISLIVGGIGITNTMYTSVLERTRQIGVMKAVGAKNRDVLAIFIFESGIIGLIGGAIGVLLGALAGKAIELTASVAGFSMLQISISPYVVVLGLLFALVIGVISGIAPARHASRLNPVEALRYE